MGSFHPCVAEVVVVWGLNRLMAPCHHTNVAKQACLMSLCCALLLPACDEEEPEDVLETFINASLTTRDGSVSFSGAATLEVDDLGTSTCRATNDEGYGLTIRWAAGTAILDAPILLNQDVFITTEAPGNPGVVVDDFYSGELQFSVLEEHFEGTFSGNIEPGDEKAITEVADGTFLCSETAEEQMPGDGSGGG